MRTATCALARCTRAVDATVLVTIGAAAGQICGLCRRPTASEVLLALACLPYFLALQAWLSRVTSCCGLELSLDAAPSLAAGVDVAFATASTTFALTLAARCREERGATRPAAERTQDSLAELPK